MTNKVIFVIFLIFARYISAQVPHGSDFDIDCSFCHKGSDFSIDYDKVTFDHDNTKFSLLGAHKSISCLTCHTTLEFGKVKTECYECHKDVHENTLGSNCQQCHNQNSWLVEKITDVHLSGRFPLVGAHKTADCSQCHASSSGNRFDVLGIECYDCHKTEYQNTSKPNHISAGFSTNCNDCHNNNASTWQSINYTHESFPLTGGHKIDNCFSCHTQGNYTGLSKECQSCHQSDFNNTSNPNHVNLNFNILDCSECHTTALGWKPAKYPLHNNSFALLGAHVNTSCDNCHLGSYNTPPPTNCYGCHSDDYYRVNEPPHATLNYSTDCLTCHTQTTWNPSTINHDVNYFPIFSGKHHSVWDACSDCHVNESNYQIVECFGCHEHNKTDTDLRHSNINGYVYQSSACLNCHPTGSGTNAYNHALSGYLLTGGHLYASCSDCHTSGYEGTTTVCVDCHINDYNTTVNPNHQTLNFSTDCQTCHTTEQNWKAYQFTTHSDYYILTGAHNTIATNCGLCHVDNNYNNTPNECVGCHQNDYNQASIPSHTLLGFSTDCSTCHTTSAWKPSTFEHDIQHFPIFTGRHVNLWESCKECHTTPNNFSNYECTSCHAHNNEITDDFHTNVQGYVYSSILCVACHPTGVAMDAFNHSNSSFPLLGAHNNTACSGCHTGSNYYIPEFECNDCHANAYDAAEQPNHIDYGISTNCVECHTVDYGWKVYQFPKHDEFYPLIGKHKLIETQCVSCHNDDYTNVSKVCYGCHIDDYNSALNPLHEANGFSKECEFCHTPNGWTPSTFNHDNEHFPIYQGAHSGTWANCSSCHTVSNDLKQFSCIDCHEHEQSQVDIQHNAVIGYVYSSNECYACHPTGIGAGAFSHSNSSLPLIGQHSLLECSACHSSGYSNTPNKCVDCHAGLFNSTTNPNHVSLNLSEDCEMCHTPEPRWKPATFPVHNDYYPLIGAHASSSITCRQCHNGDYNNTPNKCVGCHLVDYNNAVNPSHVGANFAMNCEECHTQTAWVPASFEHDIPYFPIYSGTHNRIWDDCTDCHVNQNNFAVFECVNCHEHNQTIMDLTHAGISNYQFNSNSCLICHPRGEVNKTGVLPFKSNDKR